MSLAPVLRRFCPMSRSGVLLERPIRIAEMLLGPRKYDRLKDVTAVDLLVDLDPLFHENKGGLTAGTNSAPNHHRSGILAVFDDGRRAGSLSRPDPIVLMVVGLLDSEQLLICEEDALPSLTSGPTLELTTSLEPYALVVISKELNFLQLVRLEVEFVFGYSAD